MKRIENKILVFILIGIILGSIIGLVLVFIPIYEKYPKAQYESDDSVADRGYIDSDDYEIFWFLHITDTQFLWYNDDYITSFNDFLNNTFKEIKPVIIINSGDIVNSDYEKFFTANERDQREEEWRRYRRALDNNNMNTSVYLDIIGNHDCYGDPGNSFFLKYSMVGSTHDALQYSVRKSFSFGDYAFIGLNTGEDYGVRYPFALFGYLNKNELDWYEDMLEEYEDCERVITFGHQPPLEIYSARNSNGKTYLGLNKKYDVYTYLCGHGHMNTFQNMNGMLSIETESFELNGGTYRIFAIDNNHLSSSLGHVGDWPQGIITYPPREKYINEDLGKIEKIRVLAWDPEGVDSVEWAAFDKRGNNKITDWEPLTNITSDEPLWEGDWDSDLNDGRDYTIQVKIEGGSGETIKEMKYSSKKSLYFGLYQFYPLMVISFLAFVSIIIVITAYLRTQVPGHAKRKEQNVDKKLRNLYLLKCLIFLTIPLTFGAMFVGILTANFSLFYLNSWGLHFNGLTFIYSSIIFLFCILWQGFRLSYEKRKFLTIDIFVSLFWLGFMYLFYILHYPTLAWFSPGIWGMITMDIFMLRRNIEMKKEKSREDPSDKTKNE